MATTTTTTTTMTTLPVIDGDANLQVSPTTPDTAENSKDATSIPTTTTTTLLLPHSDSSEARISARSTIAVVIIILIACAVLAIAFLLWRRHTKRRGGATLEAVAAAAAATTAENSSGSQNTARISAARVNGHGHLVVNQVYGTSPPPALAGGITYATAASSKYEFVAASPGASTADRNNTYDKRGAAPAPVYAHSAYYSVAANEHVVGSSKHEAAAASTADRNNTYDKWGAARSTPVYAHSAYYNVAAGNATAGRVVGCGATAENARAPLPSHADYSGYEVSAQQNPPRIIYAIPLEDKDEANIVYAIPVEVEAEVGADDDAATQRGAAAAVVGMPRMPAPTEPLPVMSAGHGRVPNPMYVPADASSNRLLNQRQRKSTVFAPASAPASAPAPALKSSTRGQKQRIVRPTVGHNTLVLAAARSAAAAAAAAAAKGSDGVGGGGRGEPQGKGQ